MLNCRKVREDIALEEGIHFVTRNQLPFKDSFQFSQAEARRSEAELCCSKKIFIYRDTFSDFKS